MNPHRDTQERGDSHGKIGYNEDRRESVTRSKAPTQLLHVFLSVWRTTDTVFVCVEKTVWYDPVL